MTPLQQLIETYTNKANKLEKRIERSDPESDRSHHASGLVDAYREFADALRGLEGSPKRVESLTLKQAKLAGAYRSKNDGKVRDLVARSGYFSEGPSRPGSPELWTGPEWNWYLFDLVID